MTTFPIRVQIRLYGEREVSCRACGKPFRPNEWVWCVGQGRHGKYKYECDECFEKVILVYPMRTNVGAKAFNFHLSPLERQLLRKFKTLLWTEQKKTFTSDDFRQYGLDQHIEDKQHGIGGLFARAVHNKIIKRVGTKRSVLPKNNYRKIGEYEFVEDSS